MAAGGVAPSKRTKRPLPAALTVLAVALVAVPATWAIQDGTLPVPLLSPRPEPVLEFARSGSIRDADGDKLDDDLLGLPGARLVLVGFDGPLDSAERRQLQQVPGLLVLREFGLVHGAWALLDTAYARHLAALPFVTGVDADHLMEPTLDSASRAIGARDSRRAVLEDGSQQAVSRGAWRGQPGTYEGVSGAGAMVALLDGGIDASHPALDDLDDDPTTADPKIPVRLNVWAYSILNATVGLVLPVNTSAPWVVPDPGTLGLPGTVSQAIDPATCTVPLTNPCQTQQLCTGFYPLVDTAQLLTDSLVGSLTGVYPSTILRGTPLGFPVQAPGGNPCLLLGRPLVPTDGLLGALQRIDLNQFSTIPHATALAGIISGTGDVVGSADEVASLDRWMYAGVAPGSRLVDVNVYIGMDSECIQGVGCFPGARGSSTGIQAHEPFAQANVVTQGSVVTGADMVRQFNRENPSSPVQVAVVPLRATADCGQNNHGTLFEAAMDALARANVTVVASVGHDGGEICSPANLYRLLSVGGYDHRGTITRADDAPWIQLNRPNDDEQEDMAKPELVAPGVDIMAPRTNPDQYYLVSGSSAAAAFTAGVAAIAIEASEGQLIGMALREHLIQTAYGDVDPRLDPRSFRDAAVDPQRTNGDDSDVPDGLNDAANRTGWLRQWGFGIVDARAAACALVECPLPHEYVRTAVSRTPETPWPTTVRIQEQARFTGQLLIMDPSANQLWRERDGPAGPVYYRDREGAGEGAVVNFALIGSAEAPDLGTLSPLAQAVTGPDGWFHLDVSLPGDVPPGTVGCIIWSTPTPSSPTRDGLGLSAPATCTISVVSGTSITADLCGDVKGCDKSQPVVAFQNDPAVDRLRGDIYLVDGAGNPLQNRKLLIEWEGAAPGFQRIHETTNEVFGRVSLDIPVGAQPGVFPLRITYVPEALDIGNYEPSLLEIPVVISMGTRLTLEMQGATPGTRFVNDGSSLPLSVRGTLVGQSGAPIADAPIDLLVAGSSTPRVVGAATTRADGTFTASFDAKLLLPGQYGVYARFAGTPVPGAPSKSLLTPTDSARVPFRVVLTADVDLELQRVYRGEDLRLDGRLTNVLGRPLGNRTLEAQFIGSSTIVQDLQTDRNGRFRFEAALPPSEALGPATLRLVFRGDDATAPTQQTFAVEVWGRSETTLFRGQAERGTAAVLAGSVFDDTGRPLTGRPVAVTWDGQEVGQATTDALGRYRTERAVPADHRTGPVTVRASFAGVPYVEPSNAQIPFDVVAKTGLDVSQPSQSSGGLLEFTTRLTDERGHVLTETQQLEVYLTPSQTAQTQTLNLLPGLDLSETLVPELVVRHAYDFFSGFGIRDGARVQVSLDQGKTWATIEPRDGYDAGDVAKFEGPGWTGRTTGWYPERFDLSDYATSEDLRIRLRTATNNLDNVISHAIDEFVVAGSNRIVFQDDFERFGAKNGTSYWTLTSSGPGFTIGKEALSGQGTGVLATNLAGTHPAGAVMEAASPHFQFQSSQRTMALLRYRLDVGNSGDIVTVQASKDGGPRTLLAPVGEPGQGTLPETDGWRWALYELPSAMAGGRVRIHVVFQSDNLQEGEGLQIDEFRLLRGVQAQPAPIGSGNWVFNGFQEGFALPVDTYRSQSSTQLYQPFLADQIRNFFGDPLLVPLPFEADVFGVPFDRITVYPQGVIAGGDTRHAQATCAIQPGEVCTLNHLAHLGAPVVAPLWDVGLSGESARMATRVEGQAPDRRIHIEWQDVTVQGSSAGGSRFRVTLHEGGDIEFHYGSAFFADTRHDLGSNAVVGLGLPGQATRLVRTSSHEPLLTDNLRIYYSRIHHDFAANCLNACPPQDTVRVVQPQGGVYEPGKVAEAIYQQGFDLSQAGQAYLLTRQFVSMGPGDSFTVSARPAGTTSWRALPVLMGGTSGSGQQVLCDCDGRWGTVVFDLRDFVGGRVEVRIQVVSDGAGEDVGPLLQQMEALVLPRQGQPAVSTFDSYVDPAGLSTWWGGSIRGTTDATGGWNWHAHGAGVPDELGQRHLRLGGSGPLAASREFYLVSPALDLRGTLEPELQFWQHLDLRDGRDGVVVEVSTDGGITYRPLRPSGASYDDFVSLLNGPGWTRSSYGFVEDRFDLAPYASQDVRLRLQYATLGTPFGSRWAVDDLRVIDRFAPEPPLLHEPGSFREDLWNAQSGAWAPVGLTSASGHLRAGHEPSLTVQAPGATTAHRVALPASTARGPLDLTTLFRGTDSAFGGTVQVTTVTLEEETLFTSLDVSNFVDGGAYAVRGTNLRVEGVLVARDGQAVADGLIQISIDDEVVGSARTDGLGRFLSQSIHVPRAFELGNHRLNVAFTGIPSQYLLPVSVDRVLPVLGQSKVSVVDQVADGDRFRITLRVQDDLGAPLSRTGVVVRFPAEGAEPELVEAVTDGSGAFTVTRRVPVDEESVVAFEIDALGNEFLLGDRLERQTTVPAAPPEGIPWWAYVLGALLLAGAIAVAILMLRRRREALDLSAALERSLQRLDYRLSRGDAVRNAIYEAYQGFLRAVERTGHRDHAVTTPSELARALQGSLPADTHPHVADITDLFERARYSEHPMNETDRGLARRSVERLQAALVPEVPT